MSDHNEKKYITDQDVNSYPLVSVLIPAYKIDFFEDALKSVLKQNFSSLEIIICDDSGSNDIRQVADRYIASSPFDIRYYYNETRLRESGSVIRCLKESRGEYIKFLYDDDLLEPDCIKKLLDAFNSHPDNKIASSRRHRIDESGKILPATFATSYPFQGDVILDGRDVISFLSDNIINFIGEPSCVLCRRDDLINLGDDLFQLNGKRMSYLGDLAIYVKLLSQGNLAFLSEGLSSFRVSESQISQLAVKDSAVVSETYSNFPKMIAELGWYKGDSTTNQLVNVTSLHYPGTFQQCNLLSALNSAYYLFAGSRGNKCLQQWLALRDTSEVQKQLIADYSVTRCSRSVVGIYIINLAEATELWQDSIDSIIAIEMPGIILKPVVVSTCITTVPFDGVQWLNTTSEQYVTAINQHISTMQSDWVLIMKAGSKLTRSGILQLSLTLPDAEHCAAIYGDECYQQQGEVTGTGMRPDFNLDLLLSNPTQMAKHWLFNRNLLLESGGFSNIFQQAWEFDYIIRIIEQTGIERIGHIAEPLVISESHRLQDEPEYRAILQHHLHQRGYVNSRVESPYPGLYALKYCHQAQPLVSIIIPTKDQLPVLITCITSLLEKTRYPHYEILIVDNNSKTPEAQRWLAGIATVDPERIKVLSYPHAFNYSAMNNLAASEARGEYLVLLNNDTAIIDNNWLDNLLNHAQRPEVGIVGAKLLYPDGRIQHAGVILGLRGPAEHPFIGESSDIPGYMFRLLLDQNYTAVTAACLMIRSEVYHQVGGLDEERFKVSYNDVDLCLKVRQAGYLTVWTPFAVVMHEGSVSQNKIDTDKQTQKQLRFIAEQDAFYRQWLPLIAHDPAYNPNLSLNNGDFTLEQTPELSWRPLSWRPLPVVMSCMADFTGCGQYRIIQPHQAMIAEGVIEGVLRSSTPEIAELARYAPDSIVLQRHITPDAHQWLQRSKVCDSVFKVFELDDYLPNLPLKSVHRKLFPQDILQSIRKSLSLVDRFVVSTAELAESFSGMHPDIRVAQNRLPPALWSNLISLRGQGSKPRVGWIGGASHTGDLELIFDVVRALAERVEWVFMGMCPAKLRPYIHEYHPGVEFLEYPVRMASLNLDLALAPVEDNLFNRCKSHLRLLEYGACGFPVICSDVACYRNTMPVTRVRNRYKDWMEAIATHLNDPAASYASGDALREVVHRDWMLTGEPLMHWAKLWLPD